MSLFDLSSAIGNDPAENGEYRNEVFSLRRYSYPWDCSCESVEEHHPDCLVALPNFWHFESDVQVQWYKHLGRGTKINRLVPLGEWVRIMLHCRASLLPEPIGSFQPVDFKPPAFHEMSSWPLGILNVRHDE